MSSVKPPSAPYKKAWCAFILPTDNVSACRICVPRIEELYPLQNELFFFTQENNASEVIGGFLGMVENHVNFCCAVRSEQRYVKVNDIT